MDQLTQPVQPPPVTPAKEPELTNQTPPPNHMQWLKPLSIALSVLSLGIAIAVVGFMLASNNKPAQTSTTPNPNPTATQSANTTIPWEIIDTNPQTKTFKSNNYSYQFGYPASWHHINGECAGPDTSACLDQHDFYTSPNLPLGYYPTFSLLVEKWYPEDSLDSFINPTPNSAIGSTTDFVKTITYNNTPMVIRINKYPITKFQDDTPPYWNDLGAYFLSSDRTKSFMVDFLWSTNSKTKPSQTEISQKLSEFGQVLSTFKFTNQSTDTSNWKTYTNSQLKFEIKYPSNWYAKDYVSKYGIPDPNNALFLLFDQGKEPNKIPPLTHPWPDLYISVNKIQFSSLYLNKTGIEQGSELEGEVLNKRQYSKITFAGYPANKKIQLTPDEIDGNLGTQIIFNANGYGWTINYPALDYKGTNDPLYDQILSTFKFTN